MSDVSPHKFHQLAGRCPCCGKPLEPTDLWFHPQSGQLIIGGKTIVLTQNEVGIFKLLVKVHPRTLTIEDISREMNRCRGDGGTTHNNAHTHLAHMRKKLETLGLTITTRPYMLAKISEKEKFREKPLKVPHNARNPWGRNGKPKPGADDQHHHGSKGQHTVGDRGAH